MFNLFQNWKIFFYWTVIKMGCLTKPRNVKFVGANRILRHSKPTRGKGQFVHVVPEQVRYPLIVSTLNMLLKAPSCVCSPFTRNLHSIIAKWLLFSVFFQLGVPNLSSCFHLSSMERVLEPSVISYFSRLGGFYFIFFILCKVLKWFILFNWHQSLWQVGITFNAIWKLIMSN